MKRNEVYRKAANLIAEHPWLRYGQRVMIVISQELGEKFNPLRYMDVDCFYLDEKVELFLDELQEDGLIY